MGIGTQEGVSCSGVNSPLAGESKRASVSVGGIDIIYIVSATYIEGHKIRIRFNNGVEGIADLQDYEWKGMTLPLANEQFFRHFQVDHGTIVWANDVDIAPEFFYYKVTGQYPEGE